MLTPKDILTGAIDPAGKMLAGITMPVVVQHDNKARVLLLAIAGQESAWCHRLQVGGPARSFWQFEKGGGVQGVLNHPASAANIKVICSDLFIPCDYSTVYEAMAWNDVLAACMARLLLYTDPQPLPDVGKVDEAWKYYGRNWRPGAPHPEMWPERYRVAMNLVNAIPLV